MTQHKVIMRLSHVENIQWMQLRSWSNLTLENLLLSSSTLVIPKEPVHHSLAGVLQLHC